MQRGEIRASKDNLASTLTSRSRQILVIFSDERHVSGGAPVWAHFLFVYSSEAIPVARLECMERKCALFSCIRKI